MSGSGKACKTFLMNSLTSLPFSIIVTTLYVIILRLPPRKNRLQEKKVCQKIVLLFTKVTIITSYQCYFQKIVFKNSTNAAQYFKGFPFLHNHHIYQRVKQTIKDINCTDTLYCFNQVKFLCDI